jgi:ribosome-associated toxin RatA of RatAB toxin-antitoxin module
MSDLSYFESRYGKLTCKTEDVFAFVTDIRNFEQFIPANTANNWHAGKESCSFSLPMIGTVTVKLAEKEKFSKVVFNGDALKKNDFSLSLHISENAENNADVKIMLSADLNPMMKMMASKPIGQFLELIVKEMESFTGWKETKE